MPFKQHESFDFFNPIPKMYPRCSDGMGGEGELSFRLDLELIVAKGEKGAAG